MMYTNLWYAAESSGKVGEQPVRVRMLGREFVLFRDEAGAVACLSDICPHRGSSLSRGICQDDGTISCPFHGWRFDRSGSCIKIPSQQNPDDDIPAGAKVDAYPVEEKYGLIWVFLGDDVENALPIIDIPEIDSAEWRHAHYSDIWHANQHWSKMTDLDHVHLPVVHGIDFGGDNPFRPPDHKVEILENGFRTEIRGHTPPSARSFKEYKGPRSSAVSKLAFYMPGFILRGQIAFAGEQAGMVNLFYEITTPIDEQKSKMFYIFFRNFFMEPEHDEMHVQRNLKNVFQDKANAESIMPKRAPDLDDWPLVRADREDRLISAYWKILRNLRNQGCQIDRVKLDALDRTGDYRVIPSPARKQDPDGWVFGAVPMISACEATESDQDLESVHLGVA